MEKRVPSSLLSLPSIHMWCLASWSLRKFVIILILFKENFGGVMMILRKKIYWICWKNFKKSKREGIWVSEIYMPSIKPSLLNKHIKLLKKKMKLNKPRDFFRALTPHGPIFSRLCIFPMLTFSILSLRTIVLGLGKTLKKVKTNVKVLYDMSV